MGGRGRLAGFPADDCIRLSPACSLKQVHGARYVLYSVYVLYVYGGLMSE